jgi:hypothetical protein
MLIKSQDGNMLVMFNDGMITLYSWNNKNGCDVIHDCYGTENTLGTYSTEAQAKEVLEEIMIEYSKYVYNIDTNKSTVCPKKYIMPQNKGVGYED